MSYIGLLKDWYLKRTPRDRLIYFVFLLIWIYAIWYIFFLRHVLQAKESIVNQIQVQKTEQETYDTQIKVKLINIKSKSFTNKIHERQEITDKIMQAQKKIDTLKPLLTTKNAMSGIARDILKQKNDKIFLNIIDTLPAVDWEPTNVDQADLVTVLTGDLYQYNIVLDFVSDYFSTVDFLKKIEKLPWHIYWDSLEYKVTEYPKANVKLKLHMLSDEK